MVVNPLMGQIPLKLELLEPFSLRYFVPHSGASEAVAVFERCLADLQDDPRVFRLVFVYGPEGTGKSHLSFGYRERAVSRGIRCERFEVEQLNTVEAVRGFIDAVEEGRRTGGLFIVEGRTLPTDTDETGGLLAHVRSRLLSGYSVRLAFPLESELRPLLLSILERRSLRLPEHSVQHLLRILPANPLSMERIIREIDELALKAKKRVSPGVIAQARREQGLS